MISKTTKTITNKKYINLSLVLDLDNYTNSINRWFQFRKIFQNINQQLLNQAFDEYLPIVKPVIHVYTQVVKKCQPKLFGFYTSLNMQQIQKLKLLYNNLKQYEIIHDQKQLFDKVQDEEIHKMLQKPSKTLNRLNLNEPPSNNEYQKWMHTIQVREVTIKSMIIKGKGVGSRDLGMPTANLQVTQQIDRQLLQYPNGIYIVTFIIEDKQIHMAVMSLGTNPHYQNFSHSRCVQAFIFFDFGLRKIYGSNVQIIIHRLIRLEGKFPSFDSFLHAMHNDIYVGKKYSNEYIKKTNL